MLNKNIRQISLDKNEMTHSYRVFNTWVLLDHARFAISRLRDMELAKLGLTPEQTAILNMLMNRNGKATISDLSNAWLRQRNSISTLINRMEKQGLVKKIKLPKRKEFEIEISEKGKTLHSQIPRDSLETVFSLLCEEDLKKLSQYLTLLVIKSRSMLGMNSDLPYLG